MSSQDQIQENGASLLEILEEITEIVSHAKSMPLSASVLVNQSELLALLETARAIVPEQIVAADSVLQEASAVTDNARMEAEEIVAQAHSDADQIVAQAQAEAKQLIERDAITVAAKSQATKLVDEANVKAEAIRRGADEYSDSQLEQLAERLASVQNTLDGVQDQIAAGREILAGRVAGTEESPSKRKWGKKEA